VLYDVQARTSESGYLLPLLQILSQYPAIREISWPTRRASAEAVELSKKNWICQCFGGVASPVFMHLRNCAAPEWIGGERRRY
jgi:hypothetical protein